MQHAPSRHISRMISVFQKIDFFLQRAGSILDERVGGDLGIMAYRLGEVPCGRGWCNAAGLGTVQPARAS